MADDESPETSIPFDMNGIKDEPVVPDFRASREPRRSFLGRPAGDSRGSNPKTKVKIVVPKVKPGHFVEPLTQIYATGGMAIMPFDPVCANAVLQSASKCAESLDQLAQENDSVRRALFTLTKTTALGMVLVAHLPIILAIVIHHVPAAQNYLGSMGQEMAEQIARQMNADGNAPPEAND